MSKTVKLQVEGKEALELPVLEGTLGNDVVDIRTFTKGTGMFTFDPGFVSTASCESKITFIDGDKLNIQISNLRLITKAENAIINNKGLRGESPELFETGLLVAKLHQEVNRKNAKRGTPHE